MIREQVLQFLIRDKIQFQLDFAQWKISTDNSVNNCISRNETQALLVFTFSNHSRPTSIRTIHGQAMIDRAHGDRKNDEISSNQRRVRESLDLSIFLCFNVTKKSLTMNER